MTALHPDGGPPEAGAAGGGRRLPDPTLQRYRPFMEFRQTGGNAGRRLPKDRCRKASRSRFQQRRNGPPGRDLPHPLDREKVESTAQRTLLLVGRSRSGFRNVTRPMATASARGRRGCSPGCRGRGAPWGADKGYDTKGFVQTWRELSITPHVAQNVHARKRSAIDRRTTRHGGYLASQKVRRAIEKSFGWLKTYGGWRKTRGLDRVALDAHLSVAAYNLLRIGRLTALPSSP